MKCLNVKTPYGCEQQKINCLFAEDVMNQYKQKRYGIKPCCNNLDEQYFWDLKQLLEYNISLDLSSYDRNTYRNKLYLEQRLKDLNDKDCLPDIKVKTLEICNISELIEQINLL